MLRLTTLGSIGITDLADNLHPIERQPLSGVLDQEAEDLEGQLRVKSDKTHIEHNESALTLIADIPADMDAVAMGQKQQWLLTCVAR